MNVPWGQIKTKVVYKQNPVITTKSELDTLNYSKINLSRIIYSQDYLT